MIGPMITGLNVLLVVILFLCVKKLSFAFRHFKMKQLASVPSMLKDLPSVSVCIPARNETHAMTQCLERVVASTYPKLEIIVLDDSSVDDTSFLIKSFAHDGVRFVEGAPLHDGWLGKNHALEGLFHEASGRYILYLDVDTFIEPQSIEQLVAYAEQEKAAMISVLPRRTDTWRLNVIFTTLRHFWELITHQTSSPAVTGSAWMINREVLKDGFHGFSDFKTDIQPEAKLAAHLAAQQKYRFLIGTRLLGVSYEKRYSSQVETSIRLLFPMLGRRLWKAIIALLLLMCMSLPLVIILLSLYFGWSWESTITAFVLIGFVVMYGWFLHHIETHYWWLGACLWSVVILQETLLLFLSVVRYRRHQVTWKGRPVVVSDSQAV